MSDDEVEHAEPRGSPGTGQSEPSAGAPGGEALGRAQTRTGAFIARHPAVLKVLDWARRTGPFDNVNP